MVDDGMIHDLLTYAGRYEKAREQYMKIEYDRDYFGHDLMREMNEATEGFVGVLNKLIDERILCLVAANAIVLNSDSVEENGSSEYVCSKCGKETHTGIVCHGAKWLRKL